MSEIDFHINIETYVTIIIHLFNTDLFNEFCNYIDNVKKIFANVNLIFTININNDFSLQIINKYPTAIIIKIENKGVDVLPFIQCINHIKQNNIPTNFILKIHTKENDNTLQNWRHSLINPITNIGNLIVLQHYFKTIKNIGYVGAQKCTLPKNYDLDFNINIIGLNDICEKFPHLQNNWTDFNAGNMFWINYEVIQKYLTDDLIHYLLPKFCEGKVLGNLLLQEEAAVEYLCERLFTGVFCYDRINILVNEFYGHARGIDQNTNYYYQPQVFSFYTPKNLMINV
jgi:hypothetical protein